LVKRDLQNAFVNVTQGPDLNQALAVEARQIFDLKVGVAFSRFLTLNLKKEFAKFKDKKITYGPC
jgi:DNA topoisomerase-3